MSENKHTPGEWEPIETAPRGDELILYFPTTPAGRNELPAMYRVARWPVSFPRQPTHWMPIPPPPSKATGSDT